MTRIEQIAQQIQSLSPEEFAQLRDWLLEQDWKQWDREVERDSESGRLDRLMDKAVADYRAGKSRPI